MSQLNLSPDDMAVRARILANAERNSRAKITAGQRKRFVVTQHIIDAFMRLTLPDADTGCWIWQGAIENNDITVRYGLWRGLDGITRRAARVSWVLFRGGELPAASEWVTMSCGRSLCVNPDHLVLSNAAARSAERCRMKRQASTLSEAQVLDIVRLHSQGVSTIDLAVQFGVGKSAVKCVLSGRTWGHLTGIKA